MRSWLSSSAIVLLFVLGCCGQKPTAGEGSTSDPIGTRSDTTGRHEAPKHNAPDQEKIDSLKKEKEKDKY